MAAVKKDPEPETAEKPRDRDVVLNANENERVHLANVLLGDLVGLQRHLWDQCKVEKTYDEFETVAKHIVFHIKNGCKVYLPKDKQVPPPFLEGKGHFLRKAEDKWIVVDDSVCIKEVVQMLSDESADTVMGEVKAEALQDKPAIVEEAKGVLEDGADNDTAESRANEMTSEPPAGALSPTVHDIKLLEIDAPRDEETLEKFRKSRGNQRFHRIVQQIMFGVDVIKLSSPSELRIKATMSILKQCETSSVVSKSGKSRFLVQLTDNKDAAKQTWKLLTEKESAEFVMMYIFSKLIDKDHNSAVADLQALIPTVGDPSEIASFLDYSKPSTVSVESPCEFDVLFGRGGMTNNHPGNRRFRDIISLHRPDYVRAIKIEKPNVARRIVAAIRGGNPPGRFLKRNPRDLKWYDVGNKHATEKTSQALREKSQAEKNGKVSSEGDVRKRLLEQALYEARATRMRLTKEANGGGLAGKNLDPSTLSLLMPKYVAMASNVALGGLGGFGIGQTSTTSDANSTPTPTTTGESQGGSDVKKPLTEITANLPEKPSLLEVAVLADKQMPMDESSAEPSSSKGIVDDEGNIVVTENDILCGRGGLTNHHKGNKRFRDIVALHRPDYVRAPKIHKPAVARLIVRAIRNSDPPGRFLKKDDETGKWFDIGDKRAAEKASQALREKSPEERSRLRQEGGPQVHITPYPNSPYLSSAALVAGITAVAATGTTTTPTTTSSQPSTGVLNGKNGSGKDSPKEPDGNKVKLEENGDKTEADSAEKMIEEAADGKVSV